MINKNLEDFLPDKNTSYYKELTEYANQEKISKNMVIDELKKVFDPEIPVNLYDLGLIYKISIDSKNNISIDMTLTNPNCPVAGTMPETVGKAIEKISNVSSIKVSLVWVPKWNKEMMSDEAKLALDIF